MNPTLAISNPEQGGGSPFLVARIELEGFLRHFGFRKSPFGVTPDPEFIFWSEMHRSALQRIVSSIESNLGFSVLLGEPGTGKTTLLVELLAQYRDRARTAFIFQTQCGPNDLLRYIASDLELRGGRDQVFLHHNLRDLLTEEAHAGRKVLIVIDEAQNLEARSLEHIRLLSNFETDSSKLLNVVLAGQPRLAETLCNPELSQLAQRISTTCRLQPLTQDELKDYVGGRLAIVTSRNTERIFSPESFALIASYSKGVPRLINAVCYRALLLAYNQSQRSVTPELIRQAAYELDLYGEAAKQSTLLSMRRQITAQGSHGTEDLRIPPSVPGSIPFESVGHAAPDDACSHPMNTARKFPAMSWPEPSVAANKLGQSAPQKIQSLSPRMNLGDSFVSPQTARNPEISALPITSRRRHVRRSAILLATLIGVAIAGWASWNQFRAKLMTTEAYATRQQPEAQQPSGSASELQASEMVAPRTQDFAPQTTSPESAAASGPHEGVRLPAPLYVDISRNALLPSKIPPQSLNSIEPFTSSSVMSVSQRNASLNLLVAENNPSLPELEAPAPESNNTTPTVAFSAHPLRVVRPEYPADAKRFHIEGEVDLELTIDKDGNVESVHALSGHPALVHAAEQAVRQWQYAPGAGTDFSVRTITRVRFNFKLNSGTSNR